MPFLFVAVSGTCQVSLNEGSHGVVNNIFDMCIPVEQVMKVNNKVFYTVCDFQNVVAYFIRVLDLVIVRTWHFIGCNSLSHSSFHTCILDRSCCRCSEFLIDFISLWIV